MSVSGGVVVHFEDDVIDPRDPRFQAPVVVQAQPAVARRQAVEGEVAAAGGELHAGGRRSQQAQRAALAVGAVMFVLIFYSPLLLQAEMGYTPSQAGLLLTPLGPVLDGVLNSVLALLGLHLGEADVTVHGVSCPRGGAAPPVLVG